MSEGDILRIQTNLQIATALFAIVFLLMWIAFYRSPQTKTIQDKQSG